MSDSINSTLQFSSYKIKKFTFTLNDDFNPDINEEVIIHFENEVTMYDDKVFGVSLKCSVNEFEHQENEKHIPFIINLVIEGMFKTDKFDNRLIPNSIAILFPYLRSFMSTVTAQAGIQQFILPTINISKLLEEQNAPK